MGDFGEKERDMLIEVSTNVKHICLNQKTMDAELRDHISKDDQNVRRGMWMWVTGGLSILFMFLTMGAYSYTNSVDRDLGDHETNLLIHRTSETVRALKE